MDRTRSTLYTFVDTLMDHVKRSRGIVCALELCYRSTNNQQSIPSQMSEVLYNSELIRNELNVLEAELIQDREVIKEMNPDNVDASLDRIQNLLDSRNVRLNSIITRLGQYLRLYYRNHDSTSNSSKPTLL